jgi:hypothetical protein
MPDPLAGGGFIEQINGQHPVANGEDDACGSFDVLQVFTVSSNTILERIEGVGHRSGA